MLKKAGIIAATAVAGLVALTPLAFADDVNVSGDQECSVVGEQENTVSGEQSGLLALIGGIGLGAPVQLQAPIANCLDFSNDDVTVTETDFTFEDNKIKN